MPTMYFAPPCSTVHKFSPYSRPSIPHPPSLVVDTKSASHPAIQLTMDIGEPKLGERAVCTWSIFVNGMMGGGGDD